MRCQVVLGDGFERKRCKRGVATVQTQYDLSGHPVLVCQKHGVDFVWWYVDEEPAWEELSDEILERYRRAIANRIRHLELNLEASLVRLSRGLDLGVKAEHAQRRRNGG